MKGEDTKENMTRWISTGRSTSWCIIWCGRGLHLIINDDKRYRLYLRVFRSLMLIVVYTPTQHNKSGSFGHICFIMWKSVGKVCVKIIYNIGKKYFSLQW